MFILSDLFALGHWNFIAEEPDDSLSVRSILDVDFPGGDYKMLITSKKNSVETVLDIDMNLRLGRKKDMPPKLLQVPTFRLGPFWISSLLTDIRRPCKRASQT